MAPGEEAAPQVITAVRQVVAQSPVPVIAFSPDQSIRRRIALYWGVVAKVMEPIRNADLMCEMVSDRLLADEVAKAGDRVVLVFGSPLGVPGATNSIRLHQIPHKVQNDAEE